jgi:phenylacetate-CoA ligase
MLDQQKMALYWRLPVFLQEAALQAYAGYLDSRYYGQGYEGWRRRFQAWQRRPDEIEAWQSERIRYLVHLAATKVPFYKASWRGADWRQVRSPEDLKLLPTLAKQSIRQNESSFIVEGFERRKLWLEKTSGTTGTALRIYWPMAMLPQWWALVEVAIRNVAGVGQQMPRATMAGRPVVRGDVKKPPYWRYNRRWRQLYLSAYHVSEASAAEYVRAIREHGSEWITGYGSGIAALAENALRSGLPALPLRAAIVSGDTLFPGMRASIEKFFACKCFDSYGQCEGVCMAMECPQGRMHVIPAAGVWEILREDGSPCAPGESGEIVATGLLNDAMPLIRYRSGDYAAWAEEQHCTCGNPYRIVTSLEGRVDDYLVTASGRKIGRLAGFRQSPGIHSAQLVQDAFDHAFLLVRPGMQYRYKDALVVRQDILSRVEGLKLDIVEVSEIPKTPQGKSVSVVRLLEHPDRRETYDQLLRRSPSISLRSAPRQVGEKPHPPSVSPLSPMNVVIMTSGHDVTDARIYDKLACSMQSLGANVIVVGRCDGPRPAEVKIVVVTKAATRLGRFLAQPWRCLWAARKLAADIVHFHDAELLITLPLAKLWWRRAKFIYDVHEDFANLMLVRDWLPGPIKPAVKMLTHIMEKALALFADAIVAVTPPLANKFRNRERIVGYNYVSRKFFDLAAECGRKAQLREFDLIHLGTLNSKRAVFLAETLGEFHRLRPGARSLVVGVSPEIEKIMRQRIPGGCTLIGKLPYDKIPGLLGNAKVGVDVHPWLGPHLKVALPVKVCEYMAAGCAVVSSSMPVLDHVVNDAATHLDALKLIEGGMPLDYARAAVELIEAMENGAQPGSQLRQWALEHMVWEREAVKIGQLYLRLLGKPCVI